MTPAQRSVLVIGALLLAACMVYPPWVLVNPVGRSAPAGYYFVFGDGPRDLVTQIVRAGVGVSTGLDVARLLVQVGAVAAVTAAAYVVLGFRRKS